MRFENRHTDDHQKGYQEIEDAHAQEGIHVSNNFNIFYIQFFYFIVCSKTESHPGN